MPQKSRRKDSMKSPRAIARKDQEPQAAASLSTRATQELGLDKAQAARTGTEEDSPQRQPTRSQHPAVQRFAQAWKARVLSPAPPPQPSEEEIAEQCIQKAVLEMQRAWEQAGSLSSRGITSPPQLTPREQARRALLQPLQGLLDKGQAVLSAEAINFLEKLETKGVKAAAIEAILEGSLPPHINVLELYDQWSTRMKAAAQHKVRKQSITRWRRSYAKLDWRIESDPALSPSFKELWKAEYTLIKRALAEREELRQAAEEDESDPLLPVGVDKRLSRQPFWSPVVKALVKVWEHARTTRYRAFRDIATLRSKAFPEFPHDPQLIENRYYSPSRKRSS